MPLQMLLYNYIYNKNNIEKYLLYINIKQRKKYGC